MDDQERMTKAERLYVAGQGPSHQGSPARARPKALSVRQPWASLIASGRKSIELRSWATTYRGPLLVCSGSALWRGADYPIGPRGVALCWVRLVDVREATPEDETAACLLPPPDYRYAWVLDSPRPVREASVKGRLGLWTPDDALLEAVGWES